MSEFEWRKGMRDLGGPVQPQRDLWAGIAEQLQQRDAASSPSRRRWIVPLAAAASVLVAVTAVLGINARRADEMAQRPPDTAVPAMQRADAQFKSLRTRDPRLAGAVIEVDSATRELQQSLAQQPDAVFLVGLLNRTYERRAKLARLGLASS